MEDVVAIRVTDSRGKQHFFLTWGRAFDRVDPDLLLATVRRTLPQFGLSTIRGLDVCRSLQDASGQTYFYEALLAFSQKRTVSMRTRRARVAAGKDIYYLGKPIPS
jgi:hypothetical protein